MSLARLKKSQQYPYNINGTSGREGAKIGDACVFTGRQYRGEVGVVTRSNNGGLRCFKKGSWGTKSAWKLIESKEETVPQAWGLDPELSPSQKEEISKVLNKIEREKKELKESYGRPDKLTNGKDERYNNLPMVIDLRKEGSDIMASPVGVSLRGKLLEYYNSDKAKPLPNLLNHKEMEAYKRIMHISYRLQEQKEYELGNVYEIRRDAETNIARYKGELKKLEEKYGKAAVDALREKLSRENARCIK